MAGSSTRTAAAADASRKGGVSEDRHPQGMASRREVELYVQDMKRWMARSQACRDGVQAACDAVPQGMPTPPAGVCGTTLAPHPTPAVMLGDGVSDQRLH